MNPRALGLVLSAAALALALGPARTFRAGEIVVPRVEAVSLDGTSLLRR